MRKLMIGLLCAAMMASLAFASPIATGEVARVPVRGSMASHLNTTEVLGAVGCIGQNEFVYVQNKSGFSMYQGEPAYWWGNGNGYQFTNEAAAVYDGFMGIILCDATGTLEVASDGYGWVQTRGVAWAYVSDEGTDIAVGDVLVGIAVTTPTANPTGVGGQFALGRDHAAYTSATGSGSYEMSVLNYPKALETQTTTSPILIRVLVRP